MAYFRCFSHLLPLFLLLLCCLPAASASAYYRVPAFDGKSTADGIVVATETAMLAPATFLFDAKLFPEFNRSQGFVLLSRPVALSSSTTREQASFNTSFTVDAGGSSDAVSFVVLLDSFPPLNRNKHGLRDTDVNVSAVPNTINGVAAVQVGTVSSYGPRSPGIGLNVTITPNCSSVAVRMAYDAATHRLKVYVDDATAGDPRLDNKAALLDAPLHLADRLPTRAALVGFFAAAVREVVVGVRSWELSVDRLPDDDDGQRHPSHDDGSTSSSPWLVILVAVVGSVAGVGVIMISVMFYLAATRRRAHDKELQQCYEAYFARMRL